MRLRWLSSTGFCLGVEVAPMGGILMWALHLGPWSLTLSHRWWL